MYLSKISVDEMVVYQKQGVCRSGAGAERKLAAFTVLKTRCKYCPG